MLRELLRESYKSKTCIGEHLLRNLYSHKLIEISDFSGVWQGRIGQWNSGKNLHFSDESRFNLFKCDGRKKVWRLPGERFLDACVWEKVKHDGGGKMVWGFISWDGVMELVEVKGSMDTKQYLEVL